MKLFDKLKNAIFEEEEEFDEEFQNDDIPKKKIVRNDEDEELKRKLRKRAMEERARAEAEVEEKEDGEIVKQIDVEKTIPKKEEPLEEPVNPLMNELNIPEEMPKPFPKRESRRTPIIFDDEDFSEGVQELPKKKQEEPIEVEKVKTLYGGYRDDKAKEKFKPSPNISPVYGLVEVSPVLNKENNKAPKENHVYVPKKQEDVSLDEVRQKAFGNEPYFEEDEDLGLLYEMEKDDKPEVAKVTLGDAEEYFDDLGLEYNVDYTDKKTASKPTRESKNEDLSKKVEKVKQEEPEPEVLEELEITKEQMKPRTAEEIKKIKKIENAEIENKEDEDPEEKNLYDLIDMMYDSE